MKKCLSLVLTFVLLLSAIPFGAFAAETNQPSYDLLIQKASVAFPEYTEKMQNPAVNYASFSRTASPRELLVSETRSISNTETITYTEYSDGVILLSSTTLTADTTTQDYVTGSTYRKITVDIEAAYTGDKKGYFYLEGVTYRLNDSDYDVITSAGTASKSGSCTSATRTRFSSKETDTSYAQIIYNLEFVVGPTEDYTVISTLYFYVGTDTAIVEHVSGG